MSQGAKAGGMKQCRYEQDVWRGADGHLYMKLTAIEFERATTETFALSARRRFKRLFAQMDVPFESMIDGRTNWIEVWDIARDWASDLPEAYTFRTMKPLPLEEPEHADAAAA